MSKNIFQVLATNEDSDDERRHVSSKAQPKAPEIKDSKKETRAKDAQLRERYGDKIEKNAKQGNVDGPKAKDNYAPNEKRPYERHSGTGKPAFKKNDFKKGGHGKGNAGDLNAEKTEDDNVKAQEDGKEEESKVTIVKLPEEEIVTLDDYVNNTGFTFGLKTDQNIKLKDPKTFEDANTKAIISKKILNQDGDKKNAKVQEKKQQTKNIVEIEINDDRRREARQNGKKNYVKFDKNEFPTLD